MKVENISVHPPVNGDSLELIIREVNFVNELPVKAPVKINLNGVIGAPLEFITRRYPEQIEQKRCHILVNREDLTIKLVYDESNEYGQGIIQGKLEKHPKFKEFGINEKKDWEPNELGQFCKMNRAFFSNKDENMDIVTKLKSFTAKVDSQIDKQKTEKGDFKDNYSGVVTSNLPGAFKLQIPLFKGRPAEEIEVEFYASVNGRSVTLNLVSPGACQALEELRDKVIDSEIEEIRAICPDIAIIEQ